jgi:hypothetical protein
MIDRLRRALERLGELSPEMQEEIAAHIEQLAESAERVNRTTREIDPNLPKSVRDALSVLGSWSDLQGDDEFEFFDRIRHETKPTPPIGLDDL